MTAPSPRAVDCRVLVVDDDPMFVRLTQRILRSLGCTIDSATSGTEALRRIEQDPSYDLLLLDVLMPDTSGPQVAAQIRVRHPDIPVLFMSGHTRETCAGHGLTPDAAFIAKPFNAQTLRARVDELLRRDVAETPC